MELKTISAAIKGKVVLLPFPFDDLSVAKVWPAVCMIRRELGELSSSMKAEVDKRLRKLFELSEPWQEH